MHDWAVAVRLACISLSTTDGLCLIDRELIDVDMFGAWRFA